MLEAPIPKDEAERLNDLRCMQVLDTAGEERFDRITRLAKRFLKVPIALISLIDADRQWFKSRQGLDATETPRSISFCGHAILEDDLFVVPDATADARFADNPIVMEGLKVRFYAGAQLRAPSGRKVGTLCVVDTVPRKITQDERDSLRDLADLAE